MAERTVRVWRCLSCGESVPPDHGAEPGLRGHTRSEHAPSCDGNCRDCPVPVSCGPVVETHATLADSAVEAKLRYVEARLARVREMHEASGSLNHDNAALVRAEADAWAVLFTPTPEAPDADA